MVPTLVRLSEPHDVAVSIGCWHQEQHDAASRRAWRGLANDELRALLDLYDHDGGQPLLVQNLKVVCRERGFLLRGPAGVPDRYAKLTGDQLEQAIGYLRHPGQLARLREVLCERGMVA